MVPASSKTDRHGALPSARVIFAFQQASWAHWRSPVDPAQAGLRSQPHHLEGKQWQTDQQQSGVERRHRRASDVIIMEPVSPTGVIEVIRTAVLGEDPRGCR